MRNDENLYLLEVKRKVVFEFGGKVALVRILWYLREYAIYSYLIKQRNSTETDSNGHLLLYISSGIDNTRLQLSQHYT